MEHSSRTLPGFAGVEKVARLKTAFSRLGFTMYPDGGLLPTVIDNLTGTELTDALRVYVNRLNLNPDDAPLQVGTGKELDEAAARQVLIDRLGEYPIGGHSGSFPATLARAFVTIGLDVAPDLSAQLNADPRRQVHQCLFLLGLAVNRLRNDAGTGHGRPDAPRRSSPLTTAESRLIARSTALVGRDVTGLAIADKRIHMRLQRVTITNHSRVADMDFEVHEHLVLIGPNESGKSSILRTLSALLSGSQAALYSYFTPDLVADAASPLVVEVVLTDIVDEDGTWFPHEITVLEDKKTRQLRVRLEVVVDPGDPTSVNVSRTFPESGHTRGANQQQISALRWRFLPAQRAELHSAPTRRCALS